MYGLKPVHSPKPFFSEHLNSEMKIWQFATETGTILCIGRKQTKITTYSLRLLLCCKVYYIKNSTFSPLKNLVLVIYMMFSAHCSPIYQNSSFATYESLTASVIMDSLVFIGWICSAC